MENKNELPKEIYPVDYAGFWDFSVDGKYGDSVINALDYPNAQQIAEAISIRYNAHEKLVEALSKCLPVVRNVETSSLEEHNAKERLITNVESLLNSLTEQK